MDAQAKVSRAGGVMRVRELMDQGCSKHALLRVLHEGRLIRPKRGWLALPDADTELLYAVRRGVVLSCVTVAKRLGLWITTEPTRIHAAARSAHAHLSSDGHVLHWGEPLVRRVPGALVDPIENALGYAAACLPYEEAFPLWESALHRGLVTREALSMLQLKGNARRLVNECTPFSDSGLESIVIRRLRALGLRVVAQAWVLGHRVDFLIEGWLVLQLDGSTHTGAQRDSDNLHDSLLAANRFRAIRRGYWQVVDNWPEVQGSIMLAVSHGRPR